jgi:hypothetical protein
VDRAWRLRGHVAGNAARERELAEKTPQAAGVPPDVRIDLAVGALQVGVGHDAGTAVAGTHHVDRVQVTPPDQAVQVDVQEVQAGRRAPVAEQPPLHVLRSERLAQQRVVDQVDLAIDGEHAPAPGVQSDHHGCPTISSQRCGRREGRLMHRRHDPGPIGPEAANVLEQASPSSSSRARSPDTPASVAGPPPCVMTRSWPTSRAVGHGRPALCTRDEGPARTRIPSSPDTRLTGWPPRCPSNSRTALAHSRSPPVDSQQPPGAGAGGAPDRPIVGPGH